VSSRRTLPDDAERCHHRRDGLHAPRCGRSTRARCRTRPAASLARRAGSPFTTGLAACVNWPPVLGAAGTCPVVAHDVIVPRRSLGCVSRCPSVCYRPAGARIGRSCSRLSPCKAVSRTCGPSSAVR
jgi:hypothetical protein